MTPYLKLATYLLTDDSSYGAIVFATATTGRPTT